MGLAAVHHGVRAADQQPHHLRCQISTSRPRAVSGAGSARAVGTLRETDARSAALEFICGETKGTGLRELIPHDNTSEDIISRSWCARPSSTCCFGASINRIHAMVRAHGLQRPASGSRLEGTLYLRARQRVDAMLLIAFDCMRPRLLLNSPPSRCRLRSPRSTCWTTARSHSRSSIKRGAYYTLGNGETQLQSWTARAHR